MAAKELIQTITTTSNVPSITFSNIPQDGSDLYILVSARSTAAANWHPLRFVFNSDTGNYFQRRIYGFATTVDPSYDSWGIEMPGTNVVSNLYGSASITIADYSSSSLQKLVVFQFSSGNTTSSSLNQVAAGKWTGTAPLTSLSFDAEGTNNIAAGSVFSLYKFTPGSDGVTSAS